MTLTGPLAFYTVASALLEDVGARLATTSARRPEREVLTIGPVADDDACGQLAVTILRTYYSETPPAEASGFTAGTSGNSSPCELPYVTAELAVRVVRCAPGPAGTGHPPSPESLDASARVVETDAYHTRLGVTCVLGGLLDELDGVEGFLVRDQPRVGPEGGVVGSQLNLAVWLANVCAEC